jgi:hypothetical protein
MALHRDCAVTRDSRDINDVYSDLFLSLTHWSGDPAVGTKHDSIDSESDKPRSGRYK